VAYVLEYAAGARRNGSHGPQMMWAIAGQIASNLRLGRTFADAMALEKRIEELTPDEVKAAFSSTSTRKRWSSSGPGDFKK
jgi:zinc protease